MLKDASLNELKEFLDQKASQYERLDFIENDPISIPHRYSKKEDIEIAAFFAAILAWGQRVTIINKCSQLMSLMDDAPHDFIMNHRDADLSPFVDFKHRTFNATDTLYFLSALKMIYQDKGGLEQVFTEAIEDKDESVEPGLIHFNDLFFSLPDYPLRTHKHIANPKRKSSCKRLNMFLRWMVRSNARKVDFGLWSGIKTSQLICPLDVHVERIARRFSLIERKQRDWKTAIELTNNLKKMDAKDPVKYDFALFGMGVMEKTPFN